MRPRVPGARSQFVINNRRDRTRGRVRTQKREFMPITLVNPLNEAVRETRKAAPKLDSLAGKTIGLLDISKPGGSVFLDRLESLLRERYGVTSVVRAMKPTFTKPAPEAVIDQLLAARCDAVIEALAD